MINHKTKPSELPEFILADWKPVNFFPYATYIDGIWKKEDEWIDINQSVFKLYFHVRAIVEKQGYERESWGKKNVYHDWDNKVAVEILNIHTNEVLFIGMKDWNICIGSTISDKDSWVSACPIQY